MTMDTMSAVTTSREVEDDAGLDSADENHTIRVFDDIHDPELALCWRRLEEETDCFPQMYYEWCEPWWRVQSDNRVLHIVTVQNKEKEIVGIAPLCIERRIGLRILRSYPVRSIDFYSFLVKNGPHEREVVRAITGYLKTFTCWDVVILNKANDRFFRWSPVEAAGFVDEPVMDILGADFNGSSFDDFLGKLSRKTRQEFRKKFRKFEREGNVKLICIQDAAGYLAQVDEMKRLYNARWLDDHKLPPDDKYYQCRHRAVTSLFDRKRMVLFLLCLDGQMAAYSLGFIHKQIFYDWQVSHDPSFGQFSPGILILGKTIEELISMGFTGFDFMAGDYPYKRSWSPQDPRSTNHELFAGNNSVRARLYLKYRLEWRDRLRGYYHNLLNERRMSHLKQWLESLKRSPLR